MGYNTGATLPRSTTSSGARITTSRWKSAPFGDVPARRPGHLARIRTFSRTAPGTAAPPTSGRMRRCAAAAHSLRQFDRQHRRQRSRAVHNLQPSNTQANPANERGWAYMWHSHNEREITTNNVFPGGMLMMMLVDSREFVIDETK